MFTAFYFINIKKKKKLLQITFVYFSFSKANKMGDIYLIKYTHTHTHTYIITVLVVTKWLCGFVSNQVQYNMDSAQYLG